MYFIIIVSAALSLLQFIYIIIGNNFRFLWMQGVDRNGTAPPSLMKSSSSVQIDNDDFWGAITMMGNQIQVILMSPHHHHHYYYCQKSNSMMTIIRLPMGVYSSIF